MRPEQKPGFGFCVQHPPETIRAIKLKIQSLACVGPGSISSPLPESVLNARNLSIPEIAKDLAGNDSKVGFVTEASQIENSTL